MKYDSDIVRLQRKVPVFTLSVNFYRTYVSASRDETNTECLVGSGRETVYRKHCESESDLSADKTRLTLGVVHECDQLVRLHT